MPALSGIQRILLSLFLLGAGWLAMIGPILPRPIGVNGPAGQFSAERAFLHIQAIAKEPHPSGSRANAAVREYITARLKELGLTVSTQAFTFHWRDRDISGVNLRATLAGTQKSGPALAMACHYDSVPTGPGACDDGAGVATLLETTRALKAGQALQNDLILFFTDGEEAGLRGAKAMAESTDWLKDIGVVFNFEARGVSGPVNMFETSAGNERLIREFAKAVRYPTANSLMYEVYRRMPNDTDLTVFKKAGLAGLNFGFIGDAQHYHAPTDDPAHVSKSTLQQEGSNALSVSRRFGNIDLSNLRGDDAVYFDLYGRTLVWYSWRVALLLAIVVAIGYLVSALKAGGLRVCSATPLLPVISMAIGAIFLFAAPKRATGEWALWAGVALTVMACVGMQIWTIRAEAREAGNPRRRSPPLTATHLFLGSSFWWLALTIATTVWLPGVSYLFLWPLVFALIAFAARRWRVSSWVALAILCLSALPALFLVVPLVRAFYVALGPSFLPVPMVFLTLLMALLSDHVAAVSSQLAKES